MHELFGKILAELHGAWRFRWIGVAVAWLICLGGWTFVAMLPNTFQAGARVYLDASSVLQPYLDNRIVATDIGEQLAYIQQSLLGRENLERIALENGIFSEDVPKAQKSRMLEQMQQRIQIYNEGYTDTTYFIGYAHSERSVALGIVTSLLNSLVKGTLGADKAGTETTERFLDERINEYESRLSSAEKALAEFKKRHANRLPGAQGGYFDRIRNQTEDLETRRRDLKLAESKRTQITAQLTNAAPISDNDSAPLPNSIAARIVEYKIELDRLLLQFTERHPDVISTRETIRRLTQQQERQRQNYASPDSLGNSALDANPVYQSLRIALNETNVEIASLQADIEDRSRKLSRLRALIDEVPDVEAELSRLNRDYGVVYDQYQSLVQSRETQQLSRKAADTDKFEFRVIDPPTTGVDPQPNRVLLMSFVLVASFGAAGAFCWLVSQLRPVFHDAKALRDIVDLPVLGAISQNLSPALKSQRRLAYAGLFVSLTCLVALFGGVIFYETAGPGIHQLAVQYL